MARHWISSLISHRRTRSGHHQDQSALDDLIHLAVYGRPGNEKAEVVRSLHELVTATVTRQNYNGTMLQNLLVRLPEIVTSHATPDAPVSSDYEGLINLVGSALRQLSARNWRSSSDFGHGVRAMRAICRDAAFRGHEIPLLSATTVLMHYLPETALELADIGPDLCTRGYMSHVLNICLHLGADMSGDPRVTAAFVWLLAAFAGDKPGSASGAACRLFRERYSTEGEQQDALRNAEQYLLDLARYGAVDLVRQWRTVHLGPQ